MSEDLLGKRGCRPGLELRRPKSSHVVSFESL